MTGQITDSSGAAVKGAQVTVTNVSTNVSSAATSDESGNYTVLYLIPGQYSVSVEAKGFKKLVRHGLEVRVGDKLTLDLQLEIGTVQETLDVTADAPLLESVSATTGQVIDRRRISELPLSDGNPFVLSRLAPGIAYTGDLKFSRPFDNAGTSAIVVDGAPGGNEFTLDGSPNMASGRRVAFVPPADAVQEFKVVTASFDAQQGHTAGASVDVAIKSGTNSLHGTLYEFVRNDILSANDFFLNAAGKDEDKDGKADRAPLRYNRYGGSVGGPIWVPKLYNGKDRTFFFFTFEGIKDSFPEPGLFTVPTEAERRGDFSALLSQGIRIFDPLTARRDGSRIRRSPFTNNVIPSNRLHAIGVAYVSFYPQPNLAGDAQGRNNFIGPNGRSDDFHSETMRFDHTLTDKQKFFFRYTHNNRIEARGNWTGAVNGVRPTGNFLFRINDGGTYDHVYSMTPSTILNFRIGFSRFNEPSIRQHEGEFDPASLGFSSTTASLFGGARYFPRFEFPSGTFSNLGDSLGGGSTHNIYSFQPTLSRLMGAHSVRVGYDFRSYRENGIPGPHAAGRYDFGKAFTRETDQSGTDAPIGQELAALLLGQPTGGFIDRSAFRSNQTVYNAVFFHDDWKATQKLTLNLGIRYELEGATTERFNRNIRGFDDTAASPIEAAAAAAYAANPIPEIPASAFKVRGGLLFADEKRRGFWESDKNNVQPRLGFAYQVDQKTVVRGGWAIYTVPAIIAGVNQPGFSQATQIVPTLDNGLSFVANLSNPFPSGVTEPPGSSLALATFMGRDIAFLPIEASNPQSQRWELSVQRELPGRWVVEAAVIGTRGYDINVGFNLNAVPGVYLSRSPFRDQGTVNFLTTNVANPFRGLIPGTTLGTSSTVQRQQLLRPFPQFLNIGSQRFDGTSSYRSLQLRGEKRFSHGYTLLASYTWSSFFERVSLLNDVDPNLERRVSGADIPHRIVVSGIWELPFGRGRKWGRDWHKAIDGVIGGWQLQGIFQAQDGFPLTLGNIYYSGDLKNIRTNIAGKTARVQTLVDISGFYFSDAAVRVDNDPNKPLDPVKQRADQRIRLANNIRTLPSRLPWFRGQGLHLWDLSIIKKVSISETVKVELRGEFLNAFNHAQFNNPSLDPTSTNFGIITSQNNLPRNVQLGFKVTF
jgi:hypothetical protein